MGVIIAILVAFVVLGVLCLALMSRPEETSQEDEIMQEILGRYHQRYKEAEKKFKENPEKFWEYKNEFLEWQCKIEGIREEYFGKVLCDPNVDEEYQKNKLQEMFEGYKGFIEWNRGKIE